MYICVYYGLLVHVHKKLSYLQFRQCCHFSKKSIENDEYSLWVCLGYGYGYVWVCMGMMGIFAKNCKTKTCKTTESHECSTFCEDECKKYVSEDVLKNL